MKRLFLTIMVLLLMAGLAPAADTARNQTDILALFADGQPAGSISPQDMRDYIVSILPATKTEGRLLRFGASEAVGQSTGIYEDGSGNIGILVTDPDAALEIFKTTLQLKLSYDADSFAGFTVDANDDLTVKPAATGGIRFQPTTTDSTDFFQILDQDGGTPVLNVDTTNEGVGIGTATLAGADSSARTLQLGSNFIMQDVGGSQVLVGDNVHYDGTWKYVSTGIARAMRLGVSNGIAFHIASSGPGGNEITNWDTTDIRLFISTTGNVLIGSIDDDGTPATGKLVVKGSTADGTTNILVGRDSGEANVYIVNTDGLLDTYNAQVTVGVGQPYILGNVATTGATALVGATNIVASATAGLYRVTGYMQTTTAADGACSSDVTVGWTYNSSAKSLAVVSNHDQAVDETYSQIPPTIVRVDGAANLTYAISLDVDADCTNATFDYYLTAERIQ